jgi:hypothetical protein
MTIDPQLLETVADDLEAERAYTDMLAHPETVVDAPNLFGEPIFDHCDKRQHYAVGAAANGAYVAWDAFTPYHEVGACPNAGETVDGAWQACEPTAPADNF